MTSDQTTKYYAGGLGFLLALVFGTFITYTSAVANDTSCSIVWGIGADSATIIEPEDCTNPFGASGSNIDDFALTIGTTTVSAAEPIVLPATATTTAITLTVHEPSSAYLRYNLHIFTESAGTYTEIARAHTEPSTYEDIELTLSLSTDAVQVFHAVVGFEVTPMLNQQSTGDWLTRLRSLIVPTAHAIYRWPGFEVSHIPFGIHLEESLPDEEDEEDEDEQEADEEEDEQEEEIEKPTSASNVLFLPGIQASRLYRDRLIGPENQVWTPSSNRDVSRLSMSEFGKSTNDIYTRDIVDSVFMLGSVYGNISGYFDDLVSSGEMVAWHPYAYDWRYAVDDIVRSGTQYETTRKYLVPIIEELATSSFTEQVSIVAHSNGGLLAKALIAELEDRGKEHLIDTVILIAVPQLGTPKAVGTMLHGFDQDVFGGLIISARTARNVILNMPSAYGLLPTREYLSTKLTGPVVSFSDDEVNQDFIYAYGTSIRAYSTLYDFMVGVKDERPPAETVYDATTVNKQLLDASQTLHNDILQPWRAPEHIEVVELAGVGIPTVRGFEYRQFHRLVCTTEFMIESCEREPYYKPTPQFSLRGDETVVQSSAQGYRGEKRSFVLDMDAYRDVEEISHYNITESSPVQRLISDILLSNSNQIPFIIETEEAAFSNAYYNVISLNSPATLQILDENGNRTFVDTTDELLQREKGIPGSQVFAFGSTTSVVLPADGYYTVEVVGTDTGIVTLEVDRFGTEQEQENIYFVEIDKVGSTTRMQTTLSDGELKNRL